tara:strand:- start:1355 stop:1588 length:234 start_codon:yes stop_codon:yes gene_type:complete
VREGIVIDQDGTDDQQMIINKLRQLESEHRDLDDVIERLADDKPFDQLKLQRLKKRKLILKDEMTLLRSRILPDIIA